MLQQRQQPVVDDQLHALLARPLDVAAEITRGQSHVQAHATVSAHFGRLLGDPSGACSQVPCLTPDNVERVCDKRLVRYRAMVSVRAPRALVPAVSPLLPAWSGITTSVPPSPLHQVVDMLDPEFHVASYTRSDGTTGITLYDDTAPHDLEAATATHLWQRRPLLCTLVPAQTAWAAAKWQGRPVEPQTPGAWCKNTRSKDGTERAVRSRCLWAALCCQGCALLTAAARGAQTNCPPPPTLPTRSPARTIPARRRR